MIYNFGFKEEVLKTINYLNEQIDGKFEPTFEANYKLIEKLILSNYSFDDFKIVIDKKVGQWKGTKYEQYIRPSTLFGDKFENYLHEQPRVTKNTIQQLSRCVAKVQLHDWKLDKKYR
jgi:uncharacterized phage protein (TIGR02220 family)